MSSVLRDNGFSRITSVESLKEGFDVLAAEPVDWLISSLFPDIQPNALQILKLARKEPSLARLKISLYTTPEERTILPNAFALGLFTCHDRPINKESFKRDMEGVLRSMEENRWASALTSAECLRPIIKAQGRNQSWLHFEQELSLAFPDRARLLLYLAEAQFLTGKTGAGRALLWQATQRQPELVAEVGELNKRLGVVDAGDPANKIEVGTCIVVDPDSAVQSALRECLTKCGAREVQAFEHGEACWQWLKENKEPDLLIMEWRIPGLSGPLLMQRCRSHGFQMVPVIVHSSLVQRQDEALLRELGVAEILPKPLRHDDFLNCVAATIGQWQYPSELRTLERKIRALLAAREFADAASSMQLFVTKTGDAHPIERTQLEAEFAFAHAQYEAARDLIMKSMRLGNKSVTALNLLGKSLMRLREFKAALKVFQRANDIAPNSVARLCAIAETQQELGDAVAARATLDRANNLDCENQDAINTSVNIGLTTGDADLVRGTIDKFRPTDSVLAYVNNKAVAHAQAGEFDAGIELYVNVLNAIPADKVRLRATVGYNLALAHARKGDAQPVVSTLEAASKADDNALDRKMASLLDRARVALASGKPIRLFTEQGHAVPAKPVEENGIELVRKFMGPAATEPAACCFGLYRNDDPEGGLAASLLTDLPKFTCRHAVVKGG